MIAGLHRAKLLRSQYKVANFRGQTLSRKRPPKSTRSFSDLQNRRVLTVPGRASRRPANQEANSVVSKNPERRPRNAVVVEGLADKTAVQKAVPDAVFVLGSSTWVGGKNSAAVLANLSQGLDHFQRVTVLLDPDFAGRKGRTILETAFPGQLWHAFLPVDSATASTATRWHELGNIGIEHASPQSIRAALDNSRKASLGRTFFTRDMLMTLGLVASHDDPMAGRMRARRDRVCNHLGLGICDGRQLLKQLNIFNFTYEDVMQALELETEIATNT